MDWSKAVRLLQALKHKNNTVVQEGKSGYEAHCVDINEY